MENNRANFYNNNLSWQDLKNIRITKIIIK